MFINKLLYLSSLLLLLYCSSCGIAYYNYFDQHKSHKQIGNTFEFDLFSFGYNFEADVDLKNKNDSLFFIRLSVNPRDDNCTDFKLMVFENLLIESVNISFSSQKHKLIIGEKKVIEDCYYIFKFEKITVPNNIDSLLFDISLSYLDEQGQRIYKDTTLIMYHHKGKQFYMTN